jgi:tRNA (guanine-N7-)-methyltransferase
MLLEADFELLLPLADADDDDPTLCWSQVFDNDQPVEIEIGLGKGRFLIDAAQRRPEINFVGVEWAAKYLRLAHARSVKSQLYNMRYVRADAREFVEFFVPAISVQAYHIYFPDPWPKKKHHKRRLFNNEFLREVEHTLQPGGLLWLATDFVDYYEVMLKLLQGSESMVEVDREWEGVRTNYEDKYVAQGKPIYRRVMQLR